MFETQRFVNQDLLREMFHALYRQRRQKATGLMAFCLVSLLYCLVFLRSPFMVLFYGVLAGVMALSRRGFARVEDAHIRQESRRSPSLLLCAQTFFEEDGLVHLPDTGRTPVRLRYTSLARLEETPRLFVLISRGGAAVPVFKDQWSPQQQEAWLRYLAGKAPRLKGLAKALKGRTLFKADPAAAARVEFSRAENPPAAAPAQPLPPLQGRFVSCGTPDEGMLRELIASQTGRRRGRVVLLMLVPLNLYTYATLPRPLFWVILAASALAALAYPLQEQRTRDRYLEMYREMGVTGTACSSAFDETGFTARSESTGRETRFEYAALAGIVPHSGGYFLLTRDRFLVMVFTRDWTEQEHQDFLNFLKSKNTGLTL